MYIGRGIRVLNYFFVLNVIRSFMFVSFFIFIFRFIEFIKILCVIFVGAYLKVNRVLECIRRGIIWIGVMCVSIVIKFFDVMMV